MGIKLMHVKHLDYLTGWVPRILLILTRESFTIMKYFAVQNHKFKSLVFLMYYQCVTKAHSFIQ